MLIDSSSYGCVRKVEKKKLLVVNMHGWVEGSAGSFGKACYGTL